MRRAHLSQLATMMQPWASSNMMEKSRDEGSERNGRARTEGRDKERGAEGLPLVVVMVVVVVGEEGGKRPTDSSLLEGRPRGWSLRTRQRAAANAVAVGRVAGRQAIKESAAHAGETWTELPVPLSRRFSHGARARPKGPPARSPVGRWGRPRVSGIKGRVDDGSRRPSRGRLPSLIQWSDW
jgi:hypothetical protein